MNKECCIVLRDRLIGLPFVDLLAGMVQTLTDITIEEGTGKQITKKYPVSDNVLGENCQGKEIMMIPDSRRKSIIYFEESGITQNGSRRGSPGFSSNIRLVCWMNRANLVGEGYEAISGPAIASILQRLINKNPVNVSIFTTLTVSLSRIQPQSAALFGNYTYSEPDRQYLRPPFEFFGIDLICTFFVSPRCLTDINWNNPMCY